MKVLDMYFSESKFYELREQQYKIQSLMSIFQNPTPITDNDLKDFEVTKNEIIIKLNDITIDLKKEYSRIK